MTLHKVLWPALAIAALAAPLSAQAAPVHYVFDADATGTFNGAFTGPVHGSFTVDPSKIGSEWAFTRDGSQFFSLSQDGEPYAPKGLVNWTLHGAYGGGFMDASIVRALRPDGSSELTVRANDFSTRGYSYSSVFQITYFSATDVLFTDRSDDLSVILQADRASGTYDYRYSYPNDAPGGLPIVREQHLTFNVTATAVPEPETVGLALAGMAVLPWFMARRRRARTG